MTARRAEGATGPGARKARLFREAVRQVRRRQEREVAPAARPAAGEVEKMRRRIERAFGPAGASCRRTG